MFLRAPKHPSGTRDWLLVRLRSRRAALTRGAPPGLGSSGSPWQAWRAELAWVYDHLSPDLWRELWPVFAAEEAKQLLLAVRYLAVGDREAVAEVCGGSLLAEPLQHRLQDARAWPEALSGLGALLAAELPGADRLSETYQRQGPGGVEQVLQEGVLRRGLRSARSGLLRGYFQALIDMRNLLGGERHQRWRLTDPPPWLEGGSLGVAQLERAWRAQEPGLLEELVRRYTGHAGSREKLEALLWTVHGKRLRAAGRDPLGSGVVIDYLVRWQLFLRRQAGLAA